MAFDVETNGIENDIRDGRGYATGISLATRIPALGMVSGYFPLRHQHGYNLLPEQRERLTKAIESAQCLITHNAKHDLVALETAGCFYKNEFYDTLIMAHLIHEVLPFSGKKLDSLVKYYLKDEGKKHSPEFEAAKMFWGWAGIPSDVMYDYACYDAELHYRLWEHLLPKWKAEGLDVSMHQHKQDYTRLIIEMERPGVKIDVAKCNMLAEVGDTVVEEMKDYHGVNLGSSKGLTKLLLEDLKLPVVKRNKPTKAMLAKGIKEGAPSFDKEAMEEYDLILERLDNPIAKDILTYRGWQKSTSSNYKPYVNLLSPDGRLRPNYKLHGTKTGRMSCERPNLQQIPRKSDKPWNGQLKSCFIAAEGFTLYEGDYSQLELRLATAYAQIPELIAIFEEGRDIFTELASELGWERQNVKTFVYSTQYGAGATRISHVFGVSMTEAQELIDDYYEKYPAFRLLNNMAASKCKRTGKVGIWSGRNRHFIDRHNEAHKAFNSVIQGGAADIMERSMLRVWNAIEDHDACRMLLQVHDSIVFEIRDGEEAKYLPIIQSAMENIEPDFGVRFAVDLHKWGE
jgi:DNA polymerase-1